MADLVLAGTLNLGGLLKLVAAGGGKVQVKLGDGSKADVLVADSSMQTVHGKGISVMQPPNSPLDPGKDVRIVSSFNATVNVKLSSRDAPIVALGVTLQGDAPLWPGMVLPSVKNSGVTVNRVAANVKGDQGVTFPNGGSNSFDTSGQE